MHDLLILGGVLALIAVLIAVALYQDGRGTSEGAAGELPEVGGEELLYRDDGNAPLLVNQRWNVSARPDFIIREGDDVIVVEQKNRPRGPFQSDRVQSLAGALAARGHGYPVNKMRFLLQGRTETESVPEEDAELFNQIRGYYEQVRAVRENRTPGFKVRPHKCRGCSYREQCTRRQQSERRQRGDEDRAA